MCQHKCEGNESKVRMKETETQTLTAEEIIQQNEAVRYEFKTQIRYSQCDHHSCLKAPALIDLFQDCSTFHSEVAGVGVRTLLEQGRAWVLCHWHIVIDRYPEAFEWVTVGTFASRFRSMIADRNFYLLDESDKVIVRAQSTWAYMDLAHNKPLRIEQEHVDKYGLGQALPMPPEKRKVIPFEPTTPLDPVTIARHHIDTNEHVNNSQYVQIALDVVPEELHPFCIRVDFKTSARLGDTVHPSVASDDERTVVELDDVTGNSYALIELSKLG